jgi:hypothetical protein
MYQDHDGALSFATDAWTSPNHKALVTDAWTSPNHKALVTITIHFEHEGIPICLLLDIVEVVQLHTRFNLAVPLQMF